MWASESDGVPISIESVEVSKESYKVFIIVLYVRPNIGIIDGLGQLFQISAWRTPDTVNVLPTVSNNFIRVERKLLQKPVICT